MTSYALARRTFARRITMAVLMAIGICRNITATDWPQILGPDRNGVAAQQGPAGVTPAWQARTLWEFSVGQGYAGVAVQDKWLILFHRLGDREVVQALDSGTGKPLWQQQWTTRYQSRIDRDSGPRCVPVIHDAKVLCHGAGGVLACISLNNGRMLWNRDTREEFGFSEGYFGVGSTPLVRDGRVLLNVGGRNGSGIVALSLVTGKTLWQATDEGASYSSPIQISAGDQPAALFVTRLNFVALSPDSGRVLFTCPFGRRGPTVNAANAVRIDQQHVFLTASYGVGACLVRLTEADGQVVYRQPDLLSSQYTTPVHCKGVLYGVHGREDIGTPSLRALAPLTGETFWTRTDFGMATLIMTDKVLLAMKTDGQLVCIMPQQDRYHELARFRIFYGTTRALPALANGRLFVRDRQTLKCVVLTKS